jgi:hypothetical protein
MQVPMQSKPTDNSYRLRPFDHRVDLIVRAALSAVNCSAALDSGELSAAASHLGDLREAVSRLEQFGASDRADVSMLRSQESRLSERLVSGQFGPTGLTPSSR